MVELHCHLDGSLSEKIVREIAGNVGLRIPEEEEELRRALRVQGDCSSLAEYLKCFAIPIASLVTAQNLKKAAKDLLRQEKEDGITYMELRFAPLSLSGEKMSCFEAIEAVVEGIKEGEKEYGIRGNVILCGMRHQPAEENRKLLYFGSDFFRQGVCGFDVAGDEASYPIKGQVDFIKGIKEAKMPFTLHAGECGSAQSVQDALELGAARIGHGIAMRGRKELLSLCQKKRIGIELCPTSNFQTKAVKSWEEYPFLEFYRQGLMVTVNTDNRTVSNTTLKKEWEKLKVQYNLEEDVSRVLTKNAIEVSFAEDVLKGQLMNAL